MQISVHVEGNKVYTEYKTDKTITIGLSKLDALKLATELTKAANSIIRSSLK